MRKIQRANIACGAGVSGRTILNRLICMLLTVNVTSGCKSLYDIKGYTKSNVKGSIGANQWQYGYGYTDPEAKLPDGMDMMIILTTEKPKHACPDQSDKMADGREVLIAIDKKLGELTVGGASGKYETADDLFTYKKSTRKAQVSFHNPARPESLKFLFATSGKVKISKITDTLIEGAVVAKIDRDHYVNGKFKAKICKYGQLN